MRDILRRLLRRSSVNAAIGEELEAHIAMRAELNRQSGISPEEALRAARRQFGNRTAVKEQLYEFSGFGWLDTLAADVTYALRGLRRDPGLSATCILTITIGVSSVASMFSIMQHLLLTPPPHVVEPSGVFLLHQWFPADQGRDEPADPFTLTSYPFYELLATRASTLAGVAAFTRADVPVGTGSDAVMTRAAMISAGFWRTLGARPVLGRFIRDDEAHPATGARAVVLGYAFWRNRFDARAEAVGQTLNIRGRPYEIVGVAPRGFRGVELADIDVWLPLLAREDGSDRQVTWHTSGASSLLKVVVRLKPDSTPGQSSAELTALQRVFLEDTYRPMLRDRTPLERYRHARVLLGSITGGLGDDLRPIPEARVTVWLVGIAFVLVAVACSNVGGLLMLRAMQRRREISVRLALGVSRARLARQLLTESSVLALLGAVGALIAVLWGGAWLQRTILPAMAWEPSTAVDPAVVMIAGISTLAVALVAGMAPLYTRIDILSALRGENVGVSTKQPHLQPVLLAVQTALSIVLLVGAGLFLRSLHNARTMKIGLDRDVLAVQIDFSGTGRGARDVATFFEQALGRVSSLPGVVEASLARNIPLRSVRAVSVRLPGRDESITGPRRGLPFVNHVTPGFFATTGMRMLAGRDFVETERDSGRVVIVNETMTRLAWPDRSPLGECVYIFQRETCTTVIGVVTDALTFRLANEEPYPYLYAPLAPTESGPRALLVRTAPGVSRIDRAIRDSLQKLDADVPYVRIDTLGETLDSQIRPWRLGAAVFMTFGSLAITLAIVGLWSSVSYAVSQRTHEFAIRSALGAKRRSLIALVLRGGVRNASIAVAAGLAIAAFATRFIADLLFEVSPREPAVFGTVAAGVLMTATIASFLPAWRATRIQPAEALRAD